MTCRTATGFVFHDLDFSQPAPMGFARCRRCDGYFTIEQYAAWRCEGTVPEGMPLEWHSYSTSDGPTCAFCGDPLQVDPRHRAHVQMFGSVCDACFVVVPTPMEVAHA